MKYNRFFPFKALAYADRIRKILDGKFPPPVQWTVYPSNKCPLNCKFCIMKDEKRAHPVVMDRELVLAIPDFAHRWGVRTVHFSGGGEPLVAPGILEAMRRCNELGVKVALSTNGVFLTPEIASCVDYMRVSLNAGTDTTYRLITGTRYFFNVIKNCQVSVPHCRGDFGLGYVVTPDNWKDIYKFVWLAAKMGVHFVHIRPAYLKDDAELMQLYPKIAEICKRAAVDFRHKLSVFAIKDKFDGYWTPRTYHKCRATPLHAVTAADGSFIVCQDVFRRFGRLTLDGPEKVWGSEEHRRALDEIDIDKCPRCVMNKANEIIEHVFINDEARLDLP